MKLITTILILSATICSGCMEAKDSQNQDDNNYFDTAQSIPTRTLVDGSLTAEQDEIDYYSFQIGSEKNVFIFLETTGELNAQVSLFTEEQELIAGVESLFSPDQFSALLQDGKYFLEVKQLSGSGNYRVKAGWDTWPNDTDHLYKLHLGGSYSDTTTTSERNSYVLLNAEYDTQVALRLDAGIDDQITIAVFATKPKTAFIDSFTLYKGSVSVSNKTLFESGEYLIQITQETPQNAKFTLSYLY